jgi:O-antigen ligase
MALMAALIFLVAVTLGAFHGGLWATLGIGGGLILGGMTWVTCKKFPTPVHDFLKLTTVFFITVISLNFLSSRPDISWHETLRLASIFLPLLFLASPAIAARASHPKLFMWLPFVVMISSLALGVFLYRMHPVWIADGKAWLPTKYNRGFSYIVLFAFPMLALLWQSRYRWAILPFLLCLFFPASLTESRAAKLALMLALPTIVLGHYAPVLVNRLLAFGATLCMAWPFAVQTIFAHCPNIIAKLPDSWRARMEIWDYMSYRIMERPWLGWGLGTSHTLPFAEPHGALYTITKIPAAHPHNVMTELWVELGVPGLLLGLGFAFLTLRACARLDRHLAPFALGAWVVCFTLSLIAYDFWTDSLFAAFALTGLMFAILNHKINASQPSSGAKAIL